MLVCDLHKMEACGPLAHPKMCTLANSADQESVHTAFDILCFLLQLMSVMKCQGQEVIPQRQKFHRLQCIFTFARKFTMVQLANI